MGYLSQTMYGRNQNCIVLQTVNMRTIALVLVSLAAVYGDVSQLTGYNYNSPGGRYLPAGSGLPLTGSYIPPSTGSSILSSIVQPSGSYIPSGGANLLGGGINGFNTFTGSGSSLLGTGVNGFNNLNGYQDQKHVYFYAAPEEHDEARFRIYVQPNSARNTKIIFIKSPSYGGVRPEIIAPPSQTEDKTLVYVLVKRPEHGGAITIPTGLTSRPTKPEVYFIKYKTAHDAEQAVADGINERPHGDGLSDLGSASTFVRTLGTGNVYENNAILRGTGIGDGGINNIRYGTTVTSEGYKY